MSYTHDDIDFLKAEIQHLRNLATPEIGDLYITKSDTDPAEKYGGVWEYVTTMIQGYNPNNPTYDTVGDTGGADEVAHSHPLSHNGVALMDMSGGDIDYKRTNHDWVSSQGINSVGGYTNTGRSRGRAAQLEGNTDSQSVNNMPPYTIYYIWERTS